eukprot:scaffold23911_cov127-Cylindrotheca_fusiformis.AAC.5
MAQVKPESCSYISQCLNKISTHPQHHHPQLRSLLNAVSSTSSDASMIYTASLASDLIILFLLIGPCWSAALAIDRTTSKRWNGNYRHANDKLSQVPKKKKMKFDVVANGITKTVEKKRQESLQHVLTKAIIWGLFMEDHPNLQIEYDIGDADYLPDVVSANTENSKEDPAFWGESGRMKVHKAVDLMQRYPDMHIVHCRWGMTIETFSRPLLDHLQEKFDSGELDLSYRKGKFTFCSLPLDVWRFVDDQTGILRVEKGDLEWMELEFPS